MSVPKMRVELLQFVHFYDTLTLAGVLAGVRGFRIFV